MVMDGGQPTSSNDVVLEERVSTLEKEAIFWRSKFLELDKWRETLEQWIYQNFGFHIRANTRTQVCPNSGASSGKPLHATSNGWSPDSSDLSSRVSATTHSLLEAEKVKRRGRRKKQDIDYKETDDPDEFANNVPVPKRKRGRPKKSQSMGISCVPGGVPTINSIINSSSPDIKQEPSELSEWDAVGESGGTVVSGVSSIPIQPRRGRGRPKKIKSENDEYAFDDGERERRKPGRKKRELGMPMSKTCETCVLEFENNQDFLVHRRVVHPEKFHKCTICSDTYLHAGFLARHMETHTLEKEFKCHLCISSFNTYQLLKTHCLEKHGVDLGRQTDWKRDNELAMSLKNHDFRHADSYSPSVSQSMMSSSPSPNCGPSSTSHAASLQSQLQHHLQQQQHQQQSQAQQQHQQCGSQTMHQQQQQGGSQQQISASVMGNQMNSGNNSSMQSQLQSQLSLGQMGNPNVVNQLSSQINNATLQSQLQQQQSQLQQEQQQQQHHHHHHHQQQQQLHHHHPQQQTRHHLPSLPSTDDDLDMDDDPLNSLFNDEADNEGVLGNYLNNIEPDPMQLY